MSSNSVSGGERSGRLVRFTLLKPEPLDEGQRLALLDALRVILAVAPEQLELPAQEADPGRVEMLLSASAIGRLRSRVQASSPRLALLRFEEVDLDRGEGVREVWRFREGRFYLIETVYPPAESSTRPLNLQWFAPLVVACMLACLAWSLMNVVRLFLPQWRGEYLVALMFFAALEAPYSLQIIKVRRVLSGDVTRFRAAEFALFLLLARFASYWGTDWAAIWADMTSWPHDPRLILPLETLLAFGVMLLAWAEATTTARDLERLGEPPERVAHYVAPADSLSGRFFTGGIVLVVLASIAIIGQNTPAVQPGAGLNWNGDFLQTLLQRPAHQGLILNVLLYFVLGLVFLGQVRLKLLRERWRLEGAPVDETVARRWALVSVIVVLLAAGVAFLLPTGYSQGILQVIGQAFYWLAAALSYLLALFLFLLGGLLSLILSLFIRTREAPAESSSPMPQFVAPPPVSSTPGYTPEWMLLMRTILFWALLAGGLFFVLRAYLRDHPELAAGVTRLRLVQKLQLLWEALRRWLARWSKKVQESLPRFERRRSRRESRVRRGGLWLRLGALSTRVRIQFYYWRLLERAGRVGLARKPADTPGEYEATLEPHLSSTRQELKALTEAFMQARYSRRPVADDVERRARRDWQAIRRELQTLKTMLERNADSD